MVSYQLIRVLGSILRSSHESSEVVIAALRLLHRVSRDVHVHGQIINEGLVPGLFQAIDRSFDSPLATSAACSVLAAVMEFAEDCRLDLSPFLDAHCVGSVLIKAAAHGLGDAEISASVVKCLVCAASNPVDLPRLINSAAVEGLLGLFMGATTADTRAILAEGIRQVITLLPRAVIEEFDIKDSAATLPALFLCLRHYREDLRLASQVFAIVTRHWKAHVRIPCGFVGEKWPLTCLWIRTSRSIRDRMCSRSRGMWRSPWIGSSMPWLGSFRRG